MFVYTQIVAFLESSDAKVGGYISSWVYLYSSLCQFILHLNTRENKQNVNGVFPPSSHSRNLPALYSTPVVSCTK